MTTHEETSKAAFYVSGDLPDMGRAVIIAGVDFIRPGSWVSEAYAIFTDPKLTDGGRVVTTYDQGEISEEMLPSPDCELSRSLEFAKRIFRNKLRETDADLSLCLREEGEQINGLLTNFTLARQHRSGDFGDQIIELLSFTDCSAIRGALRTFESLPRFKPRIERIERDE